MKRKNKSKMTNDFVELIAQFIEFNKYNDTVLNLKDYLIQELNYSEDDATKINNQYNLVMEYS